VAELADAPDSKFPPTHLPQATENAGNLQPSSPNRSAFAASAEAHLPLATGHLALLLAAGHLDGVVRPQGESPHVVRGTAHKVTYTASVEEIENKDGSITTKTIQSEKIVLTVRTAESDGTITTLSQE